MNHTRLLNKARSVAASTWYLSIQTTPAPEEAQSLSHWMRLLPLSVSVGVVNRPVSEVGVSMFSLAS